MKEAIQNTVNLVKATASPSTTPNTPTVTPNRPRPFRDRVDFYRYVAAPTNAYGGTIGNDR